MQRAKDGRKHNLASSAPKECSQNMDTITRFEWHGSLIVLFLLCLFVITLPLAVVYFLTHLMRIESKVADGQDLSDFLRGRR